MSSKLLHISLCAPPPHVTLAPHPTVPWPTDDFKMKFLKLSFYNCLLKSVLNINLVTLFVHDQRYKLYIIFSDPFIM